MSGFFSGTATGSGLHDDHQSTLKALGALEVVLTPRKPPVLDEAIRAVLGETARVLEEDVTLHFAFEETHLFPRIAASGSCGMVEILRSEHDDIRPMAIDLRARILGVLEAGVIGEAAWQDLRLRAGELIAREVFHIQKEEMGLLAALAQVLDDSDDQALAALRGAARG
ncbi:hemerythrin domain-containing protein [Rhodospirillum rubrum]|uniref:Hemerythrin HHE cation binding region n=1 Tax=Rhodospirillum rubrum (strain ATCC 11170 / ATH 1.1.1 / DSM 467 / LMG 4362 / NCIMB 8255 / S1) TaxID=269796 RepID=Q2RR02_RHORT|nr:hemerythrin domain-containing protein [Rhodospirillum rubrum]ABC23443.1 Hemerythrin HHE cation binding region [Rhodospirillum rubrum ATCC 11170]AEO49181.1 hemerythrin HHE cation binding region [Rhodospirillum rubrum F11]MBK5955113.1 hemerythrin [Rhodospirillum rubrum]QXG79414.1 hemerythrin domain-containing protein [Rhodospirillum rubrum]HAP98822.1 hemerythrin domain-containing protein [Rhodospirillum rubrum]